MNIANERCCIGRGLAAIHAKKDFSSFVFYTMQALKPELDKYNGEGTVFGCVNKDALNTQKVIIPPDKIISEFEKIASSLDQAYLVGFEENMRLAQLRDALLPKLMSGELDISEVQV
jgi:type I restriction enzyme S subunit